MFWGSLFQVSAAATGNAWLLTMERCVWQTVNDDDAADRRRWRSSEFVVVWVDRRDRPVSVRVDICMQGQPAWSRSAVELSTSGVDGAVEWHAPVSKMSRSAERRHSSPSGAAAQGKKECRQGSRYRNPAKRVQEILQASEQRLCWLTKKSKQTDTVFSPWDLTEASASMLILRSRTTEMARWLRSLIRRVGWLEMHDVKMTHHPNHGGDSGPDNDGPSRMSWNWRTVEIPNREMQDMKTQDLKLYDYFVFTVTAKFLSSIIGYCSHHRTQNRI